MTSRADTTSDKGFIHIRSFRSFKKAAALAVAAISVAALLTTAPAQALPSSSSFGPAIDNVSYDGQTRCSPQAKPGMLAFRRIVMARYPNTGLGGISRACNIGGQSEHKEGRAWDWGVNASYASNRSMVKDLFGWLLRRDTTVAPELPVAVARVWSDRSQHRALPVPERRLQEMRSIWVVWLTTTSMPPSSVATTWALTATGSQPPGAG